MTSAFANPAVVSQSWYPTVRSRSLRRAGVRAFDLGGRRIAIYRDQSGRAHAIDARCPHLGADLTQATVEGDAIRCVFHHWCFGPDGFCREAPGHVRPPERRARVYPVKERWGLVWVFNGPQPLFDLPLPDGAGRWRSFTLPSQRIGCHPHLVLANGLDLSHYEALHGMTFTEPPRLAVGKPYEVSVEMRGRPHARFWRLVSGTMRQDMVARFATIGGSLAWSVVSSPVDFRVLFTGCPDRAGRCVTQTIFLFRRPFSVDWIRGLGLMAALLHDDRRVLDRIDFRRQFADTDEPLKAFAGVVDAIGTW